MFYLSGQAPMFSISIVAEDFVSIISSPPNRPIPKLDSPDLRYTPFGAAVPVHLQQLLHPDAEQALVLFQIAANQPPILVVGGREHPAIELTLDHLRYGSRM